MHISLSLFYGLYVEDDKDLSPTHHPKNLVRDDILNTHTHIYTIKKLIKFTQHYRVFRFLRTVREDLSDIGYTLGFGLVYFFVILEPI